MSRFSTSARLSPASVDEVRREIRYLDPVVRQDDGSLHHVPELPYVSRPAVGHEPLASLVPQTLDCSPMLPVEMANEMMREEGDVFRMLPERRHGDGEDAQPVEQIFPKHPFPHRLGRIPVGGGEDANVKMVLLGATKPPHLSVLQNAEQLRLQRNGHFRNLIQKERAVMGEFEAPRPRAGGPGE